VRRRKVSERRACQVVGQHRSTQRYEPQPPELELRLAEPMNELAARHPRYGYRRMWALLRSEGFRVNRKHVSGCGDWRGIGCRHDRRSRAARRLRHRGECVLEPAGDPSERGLVLRLHEWPHP
jgi:putative transposase